MPIITENAATPRTGADIVVGIRIPSKPQIQTAILAQMRRPGRTEQGRHGEDEDSGKGEDLHSDGQRTLVQHDGGLDVHGVEGVTTKKNRLALLVKIGTAKYDCEMAEFSRRRVAEECAHMHPTLIGSLSTPPCFPAESSHVSREIWPDL